MSTTAQRSPVDRADRGDRPAPGMGAASSAAVPVQPPTGTVPPSRVPSSRVPSSPPAEGGSVISSGTCGTSFYDENQNTASGERFDPNGFTAAHKSLPFNTRVRVTNLANRKSVIVRINDRGPYVSGRCLDLARGAFVTIASVNSGVIDARYEVLK